MTLQIIGAGFGRTGTLSLKNALEELGFSPCHHMESVIGDPPQARMWIEAADASNFDWQRLFANYAAAVDWPTCYFWRELMAFYPDSKIILTARDAGRWYESVRNTIFNVMHPPAGVTLPLPPDMVAMANRLIRDDTFHGQLPDEAHAIEVFERHNRAVQDQVPADRLLVFRLDEGWAPLCRFLGVPVPATPFPHANSTEDWLGKFR